jgi:hypothetical protein
MKRYTASRTWMKRYTTSRYLDEKVKNIKIPG